MKAFDELVEKSQTILIITSQPLDFDCIGSGLILKKYLESLGKKVRLCFPAKPEKSQVEAHSFLPFFSEIQFGDTRKLLSNKNADILIFLDGANPIQFYDYENSKAKTTKAPNFLVYDQIIRIDHHIYNPEKFETLLIRDPKASSTAEIILTKIVPKKFIDKDLATLGYAALVGDTGNFRWAFTVRTLLLASFLLSKNAEPLVIIDKIFNNKSRAYIDMIAWAIENTEYYPGIGTIILPLSYKLISGLGYDDDRLRTLKYAFIEEIVGKIKGYSRGFIMTESVPGKIRFSSRGSSLYNTIGLPQLLKEMGGNGGGHFNAAGARIEGDFKEIKQKLIETIKEELQKNS